MNRRSGFYFELIVVVMVTLLVFAALTALNLQHNVGFIFPVPLAVFIIRYRTRDGILPAIIMLIFAPLITHFLPFGGGSWVRGLLMMLTAVTIGFLHGGLSKLKMSHLKEILIVVGAEMFLAFLSAGIFYLMKDPVFDYSVEFPHYYEGFANFFRIPHDSIYSQNAQFIFLNSVIPYIISLAIAEVLLTHVLIYLVIKYAFELTDDRPFTGLHFKLPKWMGYVFLALLFSAITSLFFLKYELEYGLLIGITILFNIVLATMIVFILQGLFLLIILFRVRRHREHSIFLFVMALAFSVPFAILGSLNVIFGWTTQMMELDHSFHF